jgi:hypothetical protein
MKKLSDLTGINPEIRKWSPSDEIIENTTLVGIEVEVENVRKKIPNSGYWNVTRDGSLRNNGIEFISIPIKGTDIVTAIDDLQGLIKKYIPNPDFSDRTSVHVHIDVREMTDQQLWTFLELYTVVERLIFDYCGDDRAENIYCVPFYKGDYIVGLISNVIGSPSRIASKFSGVDGKYQALNVKPVVTQGSLEFRHHHGTANKEDLLRWINIVLQLKAKSLEFDVHSIPHKVSGMGAEPFVKEIFGEYAPYLLAGGDIEQKIYRGLRLAQDFPEAEDYKYKQARLSHLTVEDGDVSPLTKYFKIEKKKTSKKGSKTATEIAGDMHLDFDQPVRAFERGQREMPRPELRGWVAPEVQWVAFDDEIV